jgi:hypothetical protein
LFYSDSISNLTSNAGAEVAAIVNAAAAVNISAASATAGDSMKRRNYNLCKHKNCYFSSTHCSCCISSFVAVSITEIFAAAAVAAIAVTAVAALIADEIGN